MAAHAAFGAPGLTLVLTQVPLENKPGLDLPPGGLIRADAFDEARILLVESNGNSRVLSEGFAAACDPDIAFDGQHILFAAKRHRADRWAIWEMALDGAAPRCVVQSASDCRQPVYLSSLFTLDSPEPWFTIAYVERDPTMDERGMGRSTSLYSVKLDGSERRRISVHPNSDFDPFQMRDSRLVFSGCHYPDEAAAAPGRISLFGMNIDGTELELYGGDQGKRIQHMGCATAHGWVVFVESETVSWDGAGQLGSITAQRPHHSYRPITDTPDFAYLYPSDLSGDCLLVSRRPTREPYQSEVVRYHVATGQTDPVFDSPEHHDLQAKLVRPRPTPDGRSTVVNPRFDTGILYALNCYEADPRMQPDLTPGSLNRLRVIEGVCATPEEVAAGVSPVLGRRLLGEVPVTADGSFNIQIPAEIPVQLQLLDQDGLALATCGWIWVMQKENRGCIGCHEDPELIPENSFVEAVRRSSYRLTLPPDKRRSVGFREDIMPIVRSKCASADCHGGPNTPLPLTDPSQGSADAEAQGAYAVLLGLPHPLSANRAGGASPEPWVEPHRARTSRLIWKLFGRITSRPWDPRPTASRQFKPTQMPPAEHDTYLTERERQAFVEWIDLGAPWTSFRAPETLAPAHMGAKE